MWAVECVSLALREEMRTGEKVLETLVYRWN